MSGSRSNVTRGPRECSFMSCQLMRKWSRLQGRVRGQAVPQNMLVIVELGNEALLCCVELTVCTHDRERGAAACRHEPSTLTQ